MGLLSGGLDDFITDKIRPLIGDLEWPSVLRELDSMRGKVGWTYTRRDVALQLRMLTERLGNFGYPFDAGDKSRTLSSYGSVLRIVRRRWAHNEDFGTFDSLTAVDTVRTVLVHIGDEARAAEAAALRTSLLSELVEPADERPEPADSSKAEESASAGPAESGSPAGPAKETPLSGATAWEPWNVAVIGEQADLDSLRPTRVKEMVRSLIEEVAETEGPIHKERLARLVGYGFGFSRLSAARINRITNQIVHAAVFVDDYGFVWPEGIDTNKWLIHRTSTEVQRRFEDISPIEIANAATALYNADSSLSKADLRHKVLKQFGRKKKSKGSDAQLGLGISHAISSGRIPASF
ncbi:Swt1 family HEPN domain-containing protein [Arthrobacter rhombi]